MTTLELFDGRRLDLRTSGPQDAFPLLFHHGTTGSLTPLRALERAAHAHGFRYVTWSRPGYGSSSPNPGRRVADVVPDCAAVLRHIGADRCVVAGWSGGGPHALACAAGLPEAVVAVLSIAGVGPSDDPGLDFLAGMGEQNVVEFHHAAAGADRLRRWVTRQAAAARHESPADIIDQLSTLLPAVDRALITGEFAEDLAAQDAEACRHGVEGWIEDDLAFMAPWGFALSRIVAPAFIWQGSEDLMVPAAHGRWLAAHVPTAVAHLQTGEGHLSIALGRVEAMMAELASVRDADA